MNTRTSSDINTRDTETIDVPQAPAANEPRVQNLPSLRHPAWELLAHYRAVLRAAWQHRHELAGPSRLADEAAFLPAALSLQDSPVHPAPRRLAWALMALFLIALAWAILGQVDIVAVAPGRIVVSERTKVIQPLENSVVQRILVKDGDHVAAGQALVELDPTSATADKTSVQEQLKSAQSEVLRTQALQQLLSKTEQSAATPPAQTPTLATKTIPPAGPPPTTSPPRPSSAPSGATSAPNWHALPPRSPAARPR